MNEWTIYPSINNRNRYALGSPDGRELKRGETVEILLGGLRIPWLHRVQRQWRLLFSHDRPEYLWTLRRNEGAFSHTQNESATLLNSA